MNLATDVPADVKAGIWQAGRLFMRPLQEPGSARLGPDRTGSFACVRHLGPHASDLGAASSFPVGETHLSQRARPSIKLERVMILGPSPRLWLAGASALEPRAIETTNWPTNNKLPLALRLLSDQSEFIGPNRIVARS